MSYKVEITQNSFKGMELETLPHANQIQHKVEEKQSRMMTTMSL